MGSANVSLTEAFALGTQAEVVPTPGGTDTAVYLGARIGSTPGLWVNVFGGTVAALIGIVYLIVGPQG